MKGMNPEEENEFDDGILSAIDEGLNLSASKPEAEKEPEQEPEKPTEEPVAEKEPEEDHDAPPAPELDIDWDEPEDSGKEEKPEAEKDPDEKPEDIAAGESDDGTPIPDKEDDPAASTEDESEKKPSDEFGTLDADVKPATRERFETMKSRFDEVSNDLRRVSDQNNAWMETIQRTGANPDQLGASLAYLEDINLGTPESLERAYNTMQAEMQVLAKALGKSAPGYNPLDEFDDLKKKVDDGYLDEEDALEIASARTRGNFETARKEQASQTSPQQAQQSATQDLSALGARLRKADPQYDEKLPIINQIVEDVVTSGADPSTWAKLVESGYKRIQLAAPAPAPKPKADPVPNPIRPGAGGRTGAFTKEPGSILEAVDSGIALTRRG